MTMALDAMHGLDAKHLRKVIEAMRTLGAPAIRAIDVGDRLLAIEGTHRLEAAARLGLTPIIEVVETVPSDSDVDDGAFAGAPAETIREYLLSGGGVSGARYWVEVCGE